MSSGVVTVAGKGVSERFIGLSGEGVGRKVNLRRNQGNRERTNEGSLYGLDVHCIASHEASDIISQTRRGIKRAFMTCSCDTAISAGLLGNGVGESSGNRVFE